MSSFSRRILIMATLLLSSGSLFAETTYVTGAGATFPQPIYSKWFLEFNKVDPKIEINYQAIGSGGGIRQLLSHTVDFGASDAPMSEKEMKESPQSILHIPTVIGAVAVAYNLKDLKDQKPIQISGEVLAEIFMGKIKNWSDPKIQALNPGVKFPAKDIIVVHRSDASGTTYVFAEYLSKVSPEWLKSVGVDKALRWPAGLGGKGNAGVAGLIKNMDGALGYVEYAYAHQNGFSTMLVKNASGKFVGATLKATTLAAEAALKDMPADFRTSLTNLTGDGAYPISAFTYLLVYDKMTIAKGTPLVKFLKWALRDGQKMAEKLDYAPLPEKLVGKVIESISKIKIQ